MSGQRVAYVRVSSADQKVDRQLDAVGECDKVFVEKMSARSRQERPQLAELLRYIRDGDEVVVVSMDRLARSVRDLEDLVADIRAEGASVTFLKEQLMFSPDSTDPRADLWLHLLGGMAQFERAIIRERQAEGIALAKKRGKYEGRKRALTNVQVEQARERIAAGESKAAIARELEVARSTLYAALARKGTTR